MTPPAAAPARGPLLPDRYGRRAAAARGRRGRVVAVAAFVALAVAFVVWAALAQARVEVHWADVGYVVRSDAAVQVTYDVARPPDHALTCTLRALDAHQTAVGLTQVRVPAGGPREVRRTDVVRTSARAVTGTVDRCG